MSLKLTQWIISPHISIWSENHFNREERIHMSHLQCDNFTLYALACISCHGFSATIRDTRQNTTSYLVKHRIYRSHTVALPCFFGSLQAPKFIYVFATKRSNQLYSTAKLRINEHYSLKNKLNVMRAPSQL